MAEMAAFFVTSCGTGRGKTYVSGNMIRGWLAAGKDVRVLKPVISGLIRLPPKKPIPDCCWPPPDRS